MEDKITVIVTYVRIKIKIRITGILLRKTIVRVVLVVMTTTVT